MRNYKDAEEECDPKYWPILCEDDYFDDLDKTIIMPYWIVAIAVFATGIIMIASALLKVRSINSGYFCSKFNSEVLRNKSERYITRCK